MQTIVRLIVVAAIINLLNSSHLHSNLNFQKKSKEAKHSVDESSNDASGSGIGGDSDFNKTLDNEQRSNVRDAAKDMKQKMENAAKGMTQKMENAAIGMKQKMENAVAQAEKVSKI